jgi:hypothetical protein
MNKEFNRMLKLAGLMTEGLYTAQMYSEEPVMEAPMKKMTKEKLKAKIKEMMLPEETPGEMAYAEMGSMDEASPEAMDRMSGLVPISSVGSLIDAARRIISALKEEGFEEEDIYDYIMDKVKTLSMDETLFEAKKDEESETEDVIVAKDEVPAEEAPVEDVTDTTVDIDMDGTPDIDAGSSESKAAFNKLTDAYRAAKELGDEKLIRQLANTITYFNKNIILDTNTVG